MIGVFDELPFINEGEITIEKDAIVFNYTDGIIEFDGEEDQSLSEDELKDFLQKNQQDELPVLHQKLMKKISEMRNNSEPSDDITILTLKFH